MRLSRLFGRTLREDPSDAESQRGAASHRLLVRAGCIDRVAAGVYALLPLGLRAQRKLEQIIREEMVAAGAQEVLLPVLQPIELWQRSGRDAAYGDELFRLRDRRGRGFALPPTNEEMVTRLAATFVRSHRDLPVTLFQLQTKFRDEPRPRAGLLRGREFTMKDAYSFDADEAGLDGSYQAMGAAYRRIFARCGLGVVPVEADSGAIGGKESVEFVLPAEAGEDTIVRCANRGCGYAANLEKAEFGRLPTADAPGVRGQAGARREPACGCGGEVREALPIEEVSTPGIKTIEALARFLGIDAAQTLKAVFYHCEQGGRGELVFVGIRGDLEVNEVKLAHALKCDALRLASDQEVAGAGLVAGSASPVGITGLQTVVDLSVPGQPNLVAGGNRPDVHLRHVNYGRDFTATMVADIGTAREGDPCVRCGAPLSFSRGIELGHIFKLGVRYSEALDTRYLDRDGRQQAIWMGCYGIGVGRTLAAAVEASHDARGIVWPPALAPYHVHLVALNVDTPDVARAADALYDGLTGRRVEVLFDDRPESAGVKFNDADLIGLPLRVALGPRGLRAGQVELRARATGETQAVPLAEAAERITQMAARMLT